MLKDHNSHYGWLTIVIHWLCAVLVIGLFAVGFYMVDLGYYDKGYHKLPRLHVSFGLLLGLLMLVRVLWRVINRGKPKPLPSHSKRVRLLSGATKYAFYLLIFTMIMTGYLVTTAKGDPALLFDLVAVPATVELGPKGVDLCGEIHRISGWLIVILAALHAAAALVHHFVFRDRTLKRMLKPQKQTNR